MFITKHERYYFFVKFMRDFRQVRQDDEEMDTPQEASPRVISKLEIKSPPPSISSSCFYYSTIINLVLVLICIYIILAWLANPTPVQSNSTPANSATLYPVFEFSKDLFCKNTNRANATSERNHRSIAESYITANDD